MSSSKKMTCKGTLRQVFLRVYRLQGDTVGQVGIFDPALWTIAPLTISLIHLPHPLPLIDEQIWSESIESFSIFCIWET